LAVEASRALKDGKLSRVAQIRRLIESSSDGLRTVGDEYEFRAFHLLMREFSRALHEATVDKEQRQKRVGKGPPKGDGPIAAE
jgi:hypothetical protein